MPSEKKKQKKAGRTAERKRRHHVLPYVLLIAVPAAFLGLFVLLRDRQGIMDRLINSVTTPYKRWMSGLLDDLPFAMAEVLCIGLAVLAVIWLIRTVYLLIRRPGRFGRLVRRVIAGVSAVLIIYCGFTLLWGINYYGTSFSEQAGLTRRGATTSELYSLASAFAVKLNELADSVSRDEDGVFNETVEEIFARSEGLYDGITAEYAFLDAPERTPKGLAVSPLISYLGFTGFYFPFTGEAVLNTDAPACLLPATVAHELSHQRGVTDEDEANFVAVLACLRSDDPVYQYSGCLLAYIHLSNALYEADSSLSSEVRATLDEDVRADLTANNTYWNNLASSSTRETVKNAAESAYDSFTSSYGEEDVMERYEACVELLVAYYFDAE